MIKRLLHADPKMRMTLEELENHIWLVENSFDFIGESKLLSVPTVKSNASDRLRKLKELKENSIIQLKKVSQNH